MARPTKPKTFDDLLQAALDLQAIAEDLAFQYSNISEAADELQFCANYGRIVANKTPRIERLTRALEHLPLLINPDGTIVELSNDETRRLIMDYKTGNVLDIMKEWDVINGQWIRKEKK